LFSLDDNYACLKELNIILSNPAFKKALIDYDKKIAEDFKLNCCQLTKESLDEISEEVETKALYLDNSTMTRLNTVYARVKKMAKDYDIEYINESREKTFFQSFYRSIMWFIKGALK